MSIRPDIHAKECSYKLHQIKELQSRKELFGRSSREPHYQPTTLLLTLHILPSNILHYATALAAGMAHPSTLPSSTSTSTSNFVPCTSTLSPLNLSHPRCLPSSLCTFSNFSQNSLSSLPTPDLLQLPIPFPLAFSSAFIALCTAACASRIEASQHVALQQ